MRCTILVGGQLHPQRDPVAVAAGDDPVLGVQQQGHAAPLGGTAAGKDAGHFALEVEGQAQHPAGLARAGVQHALGVQQGLLLVRAQVTGAEGFQVAVAGQRLRQQRVQAAFHGRGFVDLRQHRALGVDEHDLVVDRVLAAVFAQPFHDAAAIADASDVVAQRAVRGQEADIGGAFVQIAHHDVDDVVGAGGDLRHDLVDRFGDHRVHQVQLQPLEAFAGGGHHGQHAVGFFGAVHLRGGFDQAPQQVELVQGAFAACDIPHVGDESVDMDVVVSCHVSPPCVQCAECS